jgi:hypothetical protein
LLHWEVLIVSNVANKVKALARSPQGKALIEKARRELATPENRRRLQELKHRATRRR